MKIFLPQRQKNHAPNTVMPKLLGILVLFLLVVQIVVSNRIANYGSHLSIIEQDIQNLTEINQKLEEKIASSSSLMTISVKAKQLGFNNNTNPLYLTHDIPVAIKK